MRSRVMPGSLPTIERRLPVRRLSSVDLPTLGRPTMATSGSVPAAGLVGVPDLRYFAKTCLQSMLALRPGRAGRGSVPNAVYAVEVENCVAAHEGNPHVERLGGEQAVEGVFVVERQQSRTDSLCRGKSCKGETCRGFPAFKIHQQRSGIQFADAGFD